MIKTVRLGSRGSPLALIQAGEVQKKLFEAHPGLDQKLAIEIVPIRTTGDWRPEHKEKTFMEMGGNKGLFTKEIEEALLSGHIDMAVHSMKDVASVLPDRLEIPVVLERLDARDAFIGHDAKTLDELPIGATVGTSSLRRQSQLLARRPDLRIIPLRGNVDTRLRKLGEGIADATLLAVAGLIRMSATNRISSILDMDVMLPAAAQGIVGIEIRRGDKELMELLAPLNDQQTQLCVTAERELLRILDGSCHTPIGVHAQIIDRGNMKLDVLVARADGTSVVKLSETGLAKNAEALGQELGYKLKAQLPLDFFA